MNSPESAHAITGSIVSMLSSCKLRAFPKNVQGLQPSWLWTSDASRRAHLFLGRSLEDSVTYYVRIMVELIDTVESWG
jgi:hypothetical protein